jgi:hypothetical protein
LGNLMYQLELISFTHDPVGTSPAGV